MVSRQALPYISRSEAEAFLSTFSQALENPAHSPKVFHVWGIGGVGKTTLTQKVREAHTESAAIANVTFGRTEGIDSPIGLMKQLYVQLLLHDAWQRDPFWECCDRYTEAIEKLKTQPVSKREPVNEAQTKHVKTLLRLGVDVVGKLFLSERQEKLAEQVVERGTEAAVAGLSLREDIASFLQQHPATKQDAKLRELLLEPIREHTAAFVKGLTQQAQKRPVMLVLDTYEKVSPIIDTWLWRTLLGNTDVMQQPVWLVIAGRHNIRQEIGWSTLHQDTNCIHECTFRRFDSEQTKDYLAQINISDEADIRNIYQVTKGLPYYLNWVRSQFEKGLTLNFAEGQQEIEQLLVKWMTPAQRQVAQLAACCRQFDRALIRSLTDLCELDFATAADDTRNCFGWLTAQSFVEPVGHRWQVDDVAREVFRQGLRQTNREQFEQIYGQLADYYQHRAGAEVSPQACLPERYENPDWREPYAEHLYYFSFSRRPDFQIQFLSHLLEARFFGFDQSIQGILQALLAEGALADQPAYLSHATRRFLQEIAPAVFYGWAVLEEVPLDYAYNQDSYGLSKTATDKALQQCLSHPEQFEGLAKFMAFLCKAKRCAQAKQQNWLLKAKAQAKAIEKVECEIKSSDFLSDLYLYKLGNTFYSSKFYEEAIACYDAALAIKPDLHEALSNKGVSLDDLGRREEAIACYDAALAIKPDKHEALYNKGVSLSALGRREEAIACYDAALAIKPDLHEALYNKGVSLSALGRREEAIACYDAALAIKPDKHEALYNKACCYSLQGDTDNALRFLQDAIALDAKYQNMAQTDTDFDAIRQDPRFQNLTKTVS